MVSQIGVLHFCLPTEVLMVNSLYQRKIYRPIFNIAKFNKFTLDYTLIYSRRLTVLRNQGNNCLGDLNISVVCLYGHQLIHYSSKTTLIWNPLVRTLLNLKTIWKEKHLASSVPTYYPHSGYRSCQVFDTKQTLFQEQKVLVKIFLMVFIHEIWLILCRQSN